MVRLCCAHGYQQDPQHTHRERTIATKIQSDLLIHNAGQLVTCSSGGHPRRGPEFADAGIIADGAIAALDGKVVAVGTSEEILRSFAGDNVIDADGCVVSPGFVDPHTHIVYAGDRLNEFELKIKGAQYLDILGAGGGIVSTVRLTRAAGADDLIQFALTRLDKMLACGTTTCEIKTGYGLDTEAELKMLAVIEELDRKHPMTIVPTFLAAHTVPPEFKEDADAYVELVCGEMLPLAWKWYEQSHFVASHVPFFCDVFCESGAFSREQSQRILRTADETGFGLKAHVDQYSNLGGSGLGIEMGAASIDHLDAISDEEIEMLAASDTVGVVIPTENFSAGKTRFAPARKLIDRGCAIAISTDYNPGSAPCPSQPMAMAIAARYQKMLPGECLNAATINAAHAVGLGKSVGSIEVGKQADLLVWDVKDYREIVYEFGGPVTARVFKNGSEILK